MKHRTPRVLIALVAVLHAACGGGGSDGGGDDGGNVGFGGAQDIGQFRGILDAGEIPGEDTLDANGFFAEHYSELPPADCGETLCINPMLAVGRTWLDATYQATVQVALTTPIDPATLPRLPLNLVVVVDRSGSMAEDGRLAKVQDGLHLLIDGLQPGDRLGLVQFDSSVQVLATLDADPVPGALHAMVDNMYPGGATNIHGGLEAGFEVLAAAWSPERQNRVILLSDGLATAGITDSPQIIAMADRFVAEGTSLSTIGVGLDFDVELMRGLAEHGAGNFYFLEDAVAVAEVFTQELRTSLTTIATDVRVAVIPTDGVYAAGEVVGSRLVERVGTGYEMTIPAVFVASREDQVPEPGRRGGGGAIFVDLSPIAGALGNDVATIELRYRLPGTTEERVQTRAVTNPYAPGASPTEDTYVSTLAMLEHYAMYNMFLGLREAARMADYRYDCALAALAATRESATRWNSVYGDPDIAADLALVEQFEANLYAKGASLSADAPTRGECRNMELPPDDGDDYDDDYHYHGCYSASAGSGGVATLILIAGAVLVSRRRRRS